MKWTVVFAGLLAVGHLAAAQNSKLSCVSSVGSIADAVFELPIRGKIADSKIEPNSVLLEEGLGTLLVSSDASTPDTVYVNAATDGSSWTIFTEDRSGRADGNYRIHNLDFSRLVTADGAPAYIGAVQYQGKIGAAICKIK